MFCPKCGAKVDDDSKFCTECGASLGAAAKIVVEVRGQREPGSEPDDGGSMDAEGSPVATSEAETQPSNEMETIARADDAEPLDLSDRERALEQESTEDCGTGRASVPDSTAPESDSAASESSPSTVESDSIASELGAMPEANQAARLQADPRPVHGSEASQQVSTPKKKDHKALRIIGIAVGLVAIDILSWRLFFNKPNGNTATFGQKSAIVCTVETKITPTDKDGKKIKSYTVELVGENGYTAKARINGENGFPLSTFNDAKAGKYTLKVTNKKSQVEYNVPVRIVKKDKADNKIKSEVTVQVPDEKKQAGSTKAKDDFSENTISGQAKSSVQVGKMVAMKSADFATLLKDEGAICSDGYGSSCMSPSIASWTIPFDVSAAGLDRSVSLSKADDQSNQPTQLIVGSMLSSGYEIYGKLDSYDTGTTPNCLNQSDLESGASFDDVVLVGLSVTALDDANLPKLLNSCSLPSNGMQKFQFKETSAAVSWASTTWTGIVHNGDETHYWIVGQHQYEDADYPALITVACVSGATASDIIDRADLGLDDVWSSGSNKQKLDALAKSFTQEAGNGGMRTNVLTGEQEPIRNQ